MIDQSWGSTMSIDTKRRRPLWQGLLIVLLGWLLLAYPMFMVGIFAMIALSGCLIECSEPQPFAGALMIALLAALFVLPILGGYLYVKPSRRIALVALAVGSVLAVVALAVNYAGAIL